jgi:carboxyl-terminal processing protease
MDLEPIPTEPTTEPEPPDASSLALGPSLASSSPAAGRGRGTSVRRAVVGFALAFAFIVGIGVGTVGLPALGSTLGATPSPASSSATNLGLIQEAWDTLHKNYVGAKDLNDKALIYGAINGMTEAVGDTGHTSFLTPEERAARASDLSGSYVGIGVRIDAADDKLPLVVAVFKDSPAEKAGLKAGDEIIAVDGKSTDGKTLDDVAGWVRGPAGSSVTVKVRTGATGPEREVTMERADVAIVPITWTMVPGTKTALIRLEQFSHGAAPGVRDALKEAKAAGADKVILDLRGNPGGYVNEAEGVASQFLKDGNVFIERDAAGNETVHAVSSDGEATDLPLVVLVDAGTASSSEIVSGALQDHARGLIVGVTTYGTGTVLGEFPLSDGSALRVGTVEWLTPNGRQIWHHGITPDVIVERASDVAPVTPDQVHAMTPAEVAAIKDPQLAKALQLIKTEGVTASPPPVASSSPAPSASPAGG